LEDSFISSGHESEAQKLLMTPKKKTAKRIWVLPTPLLATSTGDDEVTGMVEEVDGCKVVKGSFACGTHLLSRNMLLDLHDLQLQATNPNHALRCIGVEVLGSVANGKYMYMSTCERLHNCMYV